MRNGEARDVDRFSAVQEQIEIDRPRPEALPSPYTTERLLDPEKPLEKSLGRELRLQCTGAVQERRLVEKPDRIRLAEGGNGPHLDLGLGPDQFDGTSQQRLSIAEIGTETDVGKHPAQLKWGVAMIRRLPLAVLVTVVALSAASVAAASSTPSSVLVAVDPGIAAERLIAGQGGRLVSKALGIWKVGRKAASRVLPELSEQGFLRYSEPNFVRAPAALETVDPLAADAWQLARVGADRAQSPGPGVPMTIIDGGIVLSYPELAGRPNVVSLNAQPTAATKVTEHGTEIAAIAGAPMNGVGTVGIYPELTLASYTLAGFDDASIIAALDAVTARGPSVVNLSLGGPGFSQSLYESILRAVNAGSIVVASAGNSTTGQAPAYYPANFPHVFTVGATARNDEPSSFSIRAKTVDLAAPGEELSVLDPLNPSQTIHIRGTSFSAPIVSAAAAWLWTARPALDETQVTEILRRTAQDVGSKGFDTSTGFGIPSIPAALAASAPAADPQEPNDDIAMVVAGGLFEEAKPALTSAIRGRVDESEDPRDVYRLVVPAGATASDLTQAAWRPRTQPLESRDDDV